MCWENALPQTLGSSRVIGSKLLNSDTGTSADPTPESQTLPAALSLLSEDELERIILTQTDFDVLLDIENYQFGENDSIW